MCNVCMDTNCFFYININVDMTVVLRDKEVIHLVVDMINLHYSKLKHNIINNNNYSIRYLETLRVATLPSYHVQAIILLCAITCTVL